ncbi:hypothetical protein ACI5LO_004197 [Salmonella enterica subsp. enterica serovar Derby]
MMNAIGNGISVIKVRVDGLMPGDKIQTGSHRLATVESVKKIGSFVVCRIIAGSKRYTSSYLSGDKIKKVTKYP